MKKLILTISAVSVASVLFAQHKPMITPQGRVDNMSKIKPANGLSRQDRGFIKDAAAANWLEIRSSEVAAQRGKSAWTKHFAKDMVTDHTAALMEVKQLARSKGVAVSAKAPAMVEAMVSHLSMARGAAFDSAYRNLQLKAHRETAAKLRTEIQNGHDSQVRGLAIKLLPVVEMHLKLAQNRQTMTHRM